MIKRRIIIITNPGEIGDEHYCEGVYRDKDNYITYFKQPYGGLYNDSEIKYFDKPSKAAIELELKSHKTDSIDMSIVVFCGHGWYSSVSKSNIICLNKTESIDSLDLRKDYKKRLIILDSCREVHDTYLLEEKSRSFSDILKATAGKQLNADSCKYNYNKTIEECSDQLIILYGCSVNEVCGDDSQFGGYYSSSLLMASKDWVENQLLITNLTTHYSIRPVSIAHQEAVPRVKKLSDSKQNPAIEQPRTTKGLPFCIVA